MKLGNNLYLVAALTMACAGADGADGTDGKSPEVSVRSASASDCPNGGSELTVGDETIIICNGADGADGADGAEKATRVRLAQMGGKGALTVHHIERRRQADDDCERTAGRAEVNARGESAELEADVRDDVGPEGGVQTCLHLDRSAHDHPVAVGVIGVGANHIEASIAQAAVAFGASAVGRVYETRSTCDDDSRFMRG